MAIREIKLGGILGGVALVSEEDYELVSQYNWHQNKAGYARGRVEDKVVLMHRFIMNAEKEQIVDHKKGNRLDNTRENLRFLTNNQNSGNKKLDKSNMSSIYKGVYYDKPTKKYASSIQYESKKHFLGRFDTQEQAAEAWDMHVIHNKLDHYTLNFPNKKSEYLGRIIEIKKNKKSEYVGVTKLGNKFRVVITVNKNKIHLLQSSNEIECAKAYDKYIVDNNIPYRKLNFPEENPTYDPNSVIKTLCEKIDKNTVRLLISDDHCVKIDKDDYDLVKYFYCSITKGYVQIKINGKTTALHRYLMNVDDKKTLVDHKNGDTYDNRKSELRLSDCKKNPQNKSKANNTSSNYIGVIYVNSTERWRCRIIKDGKQLFSKNLPKEKHVARFRDLFMKEHLKDDHYKLNFDDWDKKTIKKWKKKLNFDEWNEKYIKRMKKKNNV
jgi:AP2-like factor (euAP2 lineage)